MGLSIWVRRTALLYFHAFAYEPQHAAIGRRAGDMNDMIDAEHPFSLVVRRTVNDSRSFEDLIGLKPICCNVARAQATERCGASAVSLTAAGTTEHAATTAAAREATATGILDIPTSGRLVKGN